MPYFEAPRSALLVNSLCGADANPRLRLIVDAVVRHLHAAIKETALTPEEWITAISFLTRTGQMCDDKRQEFILLSDVLGISMLVDALATQRGPGATENTVLGPFYVSDAPRHENGADIRLEKKGEATLIEGTVTDLSGQPISGANIEVWQADTDGFYDVQRPATIPEGNLRGQFTSSEQGGYHFVTAKPLHYSIPCDGPVGELLDGLARPAIRPAHIHFIVSAPGFERVTTHFFVDDCPYLQQDPVLGVKASLIAEFRRPACSHDSPEPGATQWAARCDFALSPK
ncbi:dioxygenase family protein [Sphingobium xenophagum]|uniref:dioxygenase family protein n=1 Tax=Sphingobium xenophagum TaxID=121428 RepID=UPI000366B7E6|nr:dioxygenase [Sphingobium xenophagum]